MFRTPHEGPASLPASVAVVGLGHIGASLLGALRLHLPEVRRIGVARRAEIAERAAADGLADEASTDISALADAEVVVLCTPVDAMPAWLEAIRDGGGATSQVVTDAGSTKAWVCARGDEILGPDRFVGGHPLAGRERSGYDAAEPSLFEGAVWVLTPAGAAPAARIAGWAAAVEAIGARVVTMDPVAHDQALALVSHVPFALSAALVRAVAGAPAWPDAQGLAATGFRDMSRIAGGDPAMYAAITATNTGPMLDALDAVDRELRGLREVLGSADRAKAWFAQARDARAAWLDARERAGRPVR